MKLLGMLVRAGVLLLPWPWPLRRRLMHGLWGWRIDPRARIGLSWIEARQVVLGPGARIGHGNIVRPIETLLLDEGASIGPFNLVLGGRQGDPRYFRHSPLRDARLVLGAHAQVTKRHIIDVSDRVEIGAFTILAGFATQILTHSIDYRACAQQTGPVHIGANGFIGTGCIFLPGARVPDACVIGAGSVVPGPLHEANTLYAGNPVQARRTLAGDLAYFQRSAGYVA